MRMNEEAVLLYVTNGKNENGFPVQIREQFPVFVREKSATRTEFYEAFRSGITVARVFEIRLEDYNLTEHTTANGKKAYATQIVYDGGTYDIVRAYRKDKAMIELVCS